MPKVNIDGRDFEAEYEETILQVAARNGIWIPTLCYHAALSEQASCRLCLVELDRGGWSQLVTSCCYPVRRDIKVRVNSETAVAARRGVMELLLARCPDSPELKELARRMGVEGTPYPKVTEAQRNCILCGLCVRVCAERIGRAAIGFAGRGVNRTVAAPFRMPSEDCIGCGACAAVCPVGTIKLRLHEKEIEVSPFKSRMPLRRCSSCGAPLSGEPHMKMLEEQAPAIAEYSRLCPACRRKKSAAAFVLPGTPPPVRR